MSLCYDEKTRETAFVLYLEGDNAELRLPRTPYAALALLLREGCGVDRTLHVLVSFLVRPRSALLDCGSHLDDEPPRLLRDAHLLDIRLVNRMHNLDDVAARRDAARQDAFARRVAAAVTQ